MLTGVTTPMDSGIVPASAAVFSQLLFSQLRTAAVAAVMARGSFG